MSVFIEDGGDPEQKRILAELEANKKAREAVVGGILGWFRLRRLQTQQKQLENQYVDRGYQLGRESNGWMKGHG